MAQKSPGERGLMMPGEFGGHAGCWMAWPYDDHKDVWGARVRDAQDCAIRVASAIRAFEPVTFVVDPSQAKSARRMVPDTIGMVVLPQSDLWFRDTGPAFVKSPDGTLEAAHFIFNNWGNKFPYPGADAKIGKALPKSLGLTTYSSPLCAEGGGILVDGIGTAITTETCLMNPNRNPGLTRAEVERELFHALGVRHVVWLPGDEGEWITDGHIDGLMLFSAPGRVVFEVNPDTANPRHKVCADNLAALRRAVDVDGNPFEIALVEEAYLVEPETDATCLSYVNAYIANGGVVMPSFDTPTDAPARDVFARAFPDRQIAQVDLRDICWNGGGIHCITQQEPA
jgi:agmatine deiminase